jgi:LPXTG-motif cell wall-anchored protein
VNVLIYGHSQAQPTGMGDDMVKALGKAKVKVKRLGLQGRNDGGLLKEIDKLGDISGYDKVLLYGYGNDSTREQTQKLLAHLGPQRTILIVPPINLDRPNVGEPGPRIEAQKKRVRELSELLKIPVFGIWGGAKDFKSDKIHMRSGSGAGKPLVQRLLAELGLPYDAAVAAMLGKEQSGGSSYTGATGAAPSMPAPAAATPASAGMPMGLFIGLVAAAGLAAFFFLRRKKQGD